eukprot:15334516-Ditylum_brightwellii.AAC.1
MSVGIIEDKQTRGMLLGHGRGPMLLHDAKHKFCGGATEITRQCDMLVDHRGGPDLLPRDK